MKLEQQKRYLLDLIQKDVHISLNQKKKCVEFLSMIVQIISQNKKKYNEMVKNFTSNDQYYEHIIQHIYEIEKILKYFNEKYNDPSIQYIVHLQFNPVYEFTPSQLFSSLPKNKQIEFIKNALSAENNSKFAYNSYGYMRAYHDFRHCDFSTKFPILHNDNLQFKAQLAIYDAETAIGGIVQLSIKG